jgi:hypothetical protein
LNPNHHTIVVCKGCRERVPKCVCANERSTSTFLSSKDRAITVRAYDESMLTARASEVLDQLHRAGHHDAADFLAVRNVEGRRVDLILRGTQPEHSHGRARLHRTQTKQPSGAML